MILCVGLLLSFNWFISVSNAGQPASTTTKSPHDDIPDTGHVSDNKEKPTTTSILSSTDVDNQSLPNSNSIDNDSPVDSNLLAKDDNPLTESKKDK